VKIAELSRRAGVPQATIKYYIREGLLQAGAKSAPNQAQYSDEHLDRLKLIVVLRDVGGLSLETIKSLFEALNEAPSLQVAAMAHARLNPPQPEGQRPEEWSACAEVLASYLGSLGWLVFPDSPVFDHLVDVYVAMKQAWPTELGPDTLAVEALRPYAEAAHQIAGFELAGDVDVTRLRPEDQLRWVVLGTVLVEPVLLALRRVAQQDLGSKQWGPMFNQDASD
jgi:DNA-binding transcriptional MerR regulator